MHLSSIPPSPGVAGAYWEWAREANLRRVGIKYWKSEFFILTSFFSYYQGGGGQKTVLPLPHPALYHYITRCTYLDNLVEEGITYCWATVTYKYLCIVRGIQAAIRFMASPLKWNLALLFWHNFAFGYLSFFFTREITSTYFFCPSVSLYSYRFYLSSEHFLDQHLSQEAYREISYSEGNIQKEEFF